MRNRWLWASPLIGLVVLVAASSWWGPEGTILALVGGVASLCLFLGREVLAVRVQLATAVLSTLLVAAVVLVSQHGVGPLKRPSPTAVTQAVGDGASVGGVVTRATITDAKGSDLVLRGAKLDGEDLHKVDLARRDMAGVSAVSVDLRDADLRDSNLRGADLTRADLRGACLDRADLTGAKVALALIAGAYLAGTHLPTAQDGAGQEWHKPSAGCPH
jgi:Pentapeptide repeats (8 copies)